MACFSQNLFLHFFFLLFFIDRVGSVFKLVLFFIRTILHHARIHARPPWNRSEKRSIRKGLKQTSRSRRGCVIILLFFSLNSFSTCSCASMMNRWMEMILWIRSICLWSASVWKFIESENGYCEIPFDLVYKSDVKI